MRCLMKNMRQRIFCNRNSEIEFSLLFLNKVQSLQCKDDITAFLDTFNDSAGLSTVTDIENFDSFIKEMIV